jgi:hypothetical protein
MGGFLLARVGKPRTMTAGSAARITRHLLLPFSSPNNRNRLAILILTQANPLSMTFMSAASRPPAILNQLAAEC